MRLMMWVLMWPICWEQEEEVRVVRKEVMPGWVWWEQQGYGVVERWNCCSLLIVF